MVDGAFFLKFADAIWYFVTASLSIETGVIGLVAACKKNKFM